MMGEVLFGANDAGVLAPQAPQLSFAAAPDIQLEHVDIFTSLFEIPLHGALRHLPRGLHPSIPSLCCITFWRCESGELGPFELAFLGLACRTGIKPRQLVHCAYVDSERACDFFRSRYGFSCRLATVKQRESYDRLRACVEVDGNVILEIAATALVPVVGMGSFVKYSPALNFVREEDSLGLVQLEASYEFKRVIRGVPRVLGYDREALRAAPVAPGFAVSAAHAIVKATLHPARFIVDPVRPAEAGGVRRIEHARALG